MGHNAGGRANVGGVQFNNRTLSEVLADLRKINWPRPNISVRVIYA